MVKKPSETRKRQTDRRRKMGRTWTTVSRSCQNLGIEQTENTRIQISNRSYS